MDPLLMLGVVLLGLSLVRLAFVPFVHARQRRPEEDAEAEREEQALQM